MPIVSIQQFRATLASRSGQDTVVQAYREIARRPRMAARMATTGWIPWGVAVSATTA